MNYIEAACDQIVSPPKFRYSSFDLGNAILSSGRRYDFVTTNKLGKNLKCSLYVPKYRHSSSACIVYLHSMNGSRLECLSYIQRILQMGLSLCSFDFSGCGNSDGDTISFGANEKYDVDAVINNLGKSYKIYKFMLWGRSMGAVAAIKYYEYSNNKFTNAQIIGLILDSPFRSLKELIIELGTQKTDIPKIFIYAGFHIIKSTLQNKANFKIQELELTETIKSIQEVPLMFLVSKNDTTIDPSHSHTLFELYPFQEKRVAYFNGLHNESRDEIYMKNVLNFIKEKISMRSFDNKNVARYKRIRLEEEFLRTSQTHQNELNDECQCQLFGLKKSKSSSRF